MQRLRLFFLRCVIAPATLILVVCCAMVAASEADELLPPKIGQAEALLPDDLLESFTLRGAGERATMQIVPVVEQPFDQAVRVETFRRMERPWRIQLTAYTDESLDEGDHVLLRFSIRRIQSQDETGEGLAQARLETAGPDYYRNIRFMGRAGDDWQTYYVPGEINAATDRQQGRQRLNFRLGYYRIKPPPLAVRPE